MSVLSKSAPLTLQPSVPSYPSVDNKTFNFLNLSHTFENGIEWNFLEYGKLWTYNLTYFDFLQQETMSKEEGLELIYDFIDQSDTVKDGLEPFPISLRSINWVKFLSTHQIKDRKIDDSLYAQYTILMNNLEYHLLGNHLLENGFALLFGAYCFQDAKLYAKAKEILLSELEEQILEDGAHFELSPMYHQIMLYRVLDCINLVTGNSLLVISNKDTGSLKALLKEKAEKMLLWLNTISYEDGTIPLFNDSANAIAPTTQQLNNYAKELQINQLPITNYQLYASGYHKITKANYECIIDIGPIGPDYIPGHAHADTFNFEVQFQPAITSQQSLFIIDTGLSTYEINERRTEERSTASHNTVEIMGTNSSEVWGGFRVANRATVTKVKESDEKIVATHNGYLKKYGIVHTREWEFKESKIIIKDSLNKTVKAVARLHFHPNVTEEMIKTHITIKHQPLSNHESRVTNYQYAPEFNKLLDAKVLEIEFKKELTVVINL